MWKVEEVTLPATEEACLVSPGGGTRFIRASGRIAGSQRVRKVAPTTERDTWLSRSCESCDKCVRGGTFLSCCFSPNSIQRINYLVLQVTSGQ